MLGYAWPRPVDPVPRGNISNAVGDAPIRSRVFCVSDASSSCIWLGPWLWGSSVCLGEELPGLGGMAWVSLAFPDSSPTKRTEHKDCRGGTPQRAPRLLSSLSREISFSSHPPSPTSCPGCVGRTLTSQGMLRHTEAQGLQPVVDVRFSHRKLEFCRKEGVH